MHMDGRSICGLQATVYCIIIYKRRQAQQRQHTGKEQAGGECLQLLIVELAVWTAVVGGILGNKHACTADHGRSVTRDKVIGEHVGHEPRTRSTQDAAFRDNALG